MVGADSVAAVSVSNSVAFAGCKGGCLAENCIDSVVAATTVASAVVVIVTVAGDDDGAGDAAAGADASCGLGGGGV